MREERVPERMAIIDESAIEENARALAELVAPASLMAVLKADAYGHGAELTAKAALRGGAHALGVAHVSEALKLRRIFPEIPILAWLHTQQTDFRAALAEKIELGVNGTEIGAIEEIARRENLHPRLHLKVDSGMGRNGAPVQDWEKLCERLARLQAEGVLSVVGIMSHLAVADQPQRPENRQQLESFNRACEIAQEKGLTSLRKHIANTPAALILPEARMDMVRVGLGIYGLSPFEDREATEFGLRAAMTLKTSVSLVKKLPAGHGISYGLIHHTAQETHVGLIPVGYGDGIPRISEGAKVLIAGRTYPVIGRIAMDQFMVDLGPEEAAMNLLGESVTLFGPGGPSVESWAASAGTINYEIITRISPRIERIAETEITSSRQELDGLAGSEHLVTTPEQMRELGARLGAELDAGDLLILSGPLGAGKTTLTQGLAEGLGVQGRVISPTFVLSRIHENDPHGPRPEGPRLVHMDAYRLGTEADLADLGIDENMEQSVTVIEWGEEIDERWGRRRIRIDIQRALQAAQAREEEGTLIFDDEEEEDVRTVNISLLRGKKK